MSSSSPDDRRISDFGDRFDVVCPSCSQRALVRSPAADASDATVTCTSCGYSKRVAVRGPGAVTIRVGDATDWYFRLSLWLSTPCLGHELWAYNREHLEFLTSYLSATVRAPTYRDQAHGYRNKSLASRLPTWMKLAKNRQSVVAALERLHDKLEQS